MNRVIHVEGLTKVFKTRVKSVGLAGAVKGTRQQEDEIDLSLELLDVDALDTGRHRALVVVDPQDRRGIKGFLYLSSVYSESIERADLDSPRPRRNGFVFESSVRQAGEHETLHGLADQMQQRTQVRAEVLDGLALDDPRLQEVPFVLLTINHHFTLR